MKKIIIPVDFSEGSEKTYELVRELGKNNKIEITLFHQADLPLLPGNFLSPVDYIGDFMAGQLKRYENQLIELAKSNYWEGMKVNTEFVSDPGSTADESFCKFANDGDFDLVVMYSKHRTGSEGLFPGSILFRVLRNCHVPMLILSPESSARINRMAYASDLSTESATVFNKIREIGDLLKSQIDIFKITTPEEFEDFSSFSEKRIQFINKIGYDDIPTIENHNAWNLERGIIQYTDDNMIDMIVMATHARSGMGRIFNRSITENLISATQQAILVINLKGN